MKKKCKQHNSWWFKKKWSWERSAPKGDETWANFSCWQNHLAVHIHMLIEYERHSNHNLDTCSLVFHLLPFFAPVIISHYFHFRGAIYKFCTRFWHITYVNRCMFDFRMVTGKWHVKSWHPFISKVPVCTLECNLRRLCTWNKWRIDWIRAIHAEMHTTNNTHTKNG